MKVVPSVPFGSRGCSVLHSRTTDPEGFVSVPPCRGCGMPQHISAEAVKIMAHEFGAVSRDEAIDARFRISMLEKELDEALETVARNEKLEEELVEARRTIAEGDDIRATLAALGEQGLSPRQIKGALDRLARLKADLGGAEDVLVETLETANRIADLSKEKVTA